MVLRPALASVVLACAIVAQSASVGVAHAEPPKAAPAAASGNVSAQDHATAEEQFKKARALYLEGRYVEARTALLEARKLDPNAKDLVFNLGVVAEKLLEYDEAITYLREYKAMDSVTEAEAQRADTSIRRIEGARALHPKVQPAPVAPPPAPAPRAEPAKHGRIDALTVTGLGVTGAALATGIVFGVLAVSSKPASTVTTGESNTFAQVDSNNARAQTFGLVADIGFGVAIAGAVTTAVLYFARTKQPARSGVAVVAAPGGWKVQF